MTIGTGALQPGEAEMTKEQVDTLGIGGQLGRGWDQLGNFLFGEKSALHDTIIPSIVGGAGNIAFGGIGNATVIKPLEGAATALHAVPLGWLPGGADETFTKLGEWAKANDPNLYQQWRQVDAAAAGQWGAGDLHADFNTEALKYIDDQHKETALGTSPTLAIGRAGVGSLGGAVGNAIGGWLGLLGNEAQKVLGNAGIYDPSAGRMSYEQSVKYFAEDPDILQPDNRYAMEQLASGKFTEQQARDYIDKNAGGRNRVDEAAARLDRGDKISDIEKQAVEAYRSGQWSLDHAETWLVTHGQGVTRDPLGQIVGSALSDPLTYATVGAGSVSKLGKIGLAASEAGIAPVTTYEKLAATINAVQQSQLGPAFRIARGLVDPLAVYKPSSVARAVTDLRNGAALSAYGRAFGPQSVLDLRAYARAADLTPQVDSAIASYSIDQANLMIARKAQRDLLEQGLGEEMAHVSGWGVDDVIDPMAKSASRDAVTELTDHMMSTAKNTFTAEEEASLAGRLAATLGRDVPYWTSEMGKMSFDLKSALHNVTYKLTEVEFEQAKSLINVAAYTGDLPFRNMVLMTSDTLDNETAQAIVDNIRDVLKADPNDVAGRISAATDQWNASARRYPAMANIGYATGGREQVQRLATELDKTLQSGGITRRATTDELADPAMHPIQSMLDRHTGIDGKPLWKVGFRPDEEVAWGLKRDANTGRYIVDRDPTISHVVDAVPGRQPFSDTTRNVLGQIIGKSKAERLNAPIDSIEAMTNTMRDVISGRRLVLNIERRFERSTFDAGIPKPLAKEIFAKAREVAGLDYSTVRGIKPGNLWDSIHDIIPRNLVLKDGSTVNVHIVMDHLLKAAEGDLRVMGVTSVLSQRMRNALRLSGLDPANWGGQMTVTMYNKLRYSQPTFLIQRITDAPYYSILYGVTPVGKGALKGADAELAAITENMGRSQTARDFSIDMPEYATRSNFTAGIKSSMQEMGLKDNKLQRILEAPDTIIANNMTHMLHARLGDIVRGALDNLASAAEKADPAFRAEMLAAGDELQRSFADWRRVYSNAAGRVLDDNEVGLKYLQDQLNAWRRHVVRADGTIDMQRLIHEGERAMPDHIADIGPIRPDDLAQELGYTDAAALRRDTTGHIEKINGTFTLVPGEHDMPWLEEQLRETMGAHPDYTRRASAYFGETWDGFWNRLGKGVDDGGLDISPHYAKEAQDLIAMTARERGMDPWEYLSGVMASNIGAKDLETHMGQLVSFLKAGKAKQPLEEWTKMFRATLDPSAQAKLLQEFEAAVPVEDVLPNIPTPGAFAKDAKGNAVMPKGYAAEPGYVYRIDVLDKMRGGMRNGEGVSTDANPIYASGRPGEGVFRVKAADEAATKAPATAPAVAAPADLAKYQTEKDAYDNAVEAANEGPQQQLDDFAAKWTDASKNHLRMEKDLTKLETDGFDTHDAMDALEEYRNVERGDFEGGADGLEEYQQARDDAWQEVIDKVGEIDATDVSNDRIGALVEPTSPAAPPAMEFKVGSGRNAAAQPGGKDRLTKAAIPPENIEMLGPDGKWTSLGEDPMTKIMAKDFPDRVKARILSGVPDPNPEIESYMGALSKWVQDSIGGELGGRTRSDLRRLVEAVPTTNASSFNRSQALVVSLLKDKINDAQQDIFRLAEMQTKRSVLERSLNHPLFGLYPASYMWGKVLPETVKFLSKNPYAATYVIGDVSRSIAIQREYNPDMEHIMNGVDRSSAAFLLDYLTPGLPWSDHSARMSPMVRDLLEGAPGKIWDDELATVSPKRWISQVANTGKEALGVAENLGAPPVPTQVGNLQRIVSAAGGSATEPAAPTQITGPVQASGLASILSDDLSRLQSILLGGASATP